ncbi:hypothetical protein HMI54_003034 [Coelomomyces lativittatus]|nr:hypothetical protein HMI55_000789 [Coelomomyces lativittatus]KAJ1518012.1 hypothetical protein HMI54_003034 [Coelomomyces lativittatus]
MAFLLTSLVSFVFLLKVSFICLLLPWKPNGLHASPLHSKIHPIELDEQQQQQQQKQQLFFSNFVEKKEHHRVSESTSSPLYMAPLKSTVHSWKLCSLNPEEDRLQIDTLKIETEHTVFPKNQLKVTGLGRLLEPIDENAQVHLQVGLQDNHIVLFDKTLNLCTALNQVHQSCPLNSTLNVHEQMELSVPRLKYSIYLKATTGQGQPITCLQIQLAL